ncbi:MAG: DNA polymerase III subunit delta [Eggerthellaceae bacterium]|nr:DNA polymerase III subunit delta [Eggerthellaceae bacterium]
MPQDKTSKLLPAYLVVGEDELKRRTVLEKLRSRVAQVGDLEFNHDEFDGETAKGDAIVQACNTLPFASELRLVEVVQVEKLAKQDLEALVAYLAQPCESTVLALSGLKLAKNTRLYKAIVGIDKKAVVDCAPMKRHELIRALRSMAVGHGFTMTEGASAKLVELIGEDTVALDSELAKLALSRNDGNPVTERGIDALVTRTAEAKPWELVDAFAARDARQCAVLLPLMTSSSPYALIGMCTMRLRELACAKSLESRGELPNLASTLKVQPWRVKNHARWAGRWAERELERAFSTARDCERAMKSGTDPDTAFRDWLFSTIA